MSDVLYDYQRDAVEKLHSGSILVGGVGAGKSITAVCYYFEKILKGCQDTLTIQNHIPLYIITTARKRDTMEWEKELNRFLLTAEAIDSWNNIQKYKDVKQAFFIFDEQRLVGYGVWVKAFFKIAKNNRWILLTATPGDTWTDFIPVFVANGFYRNKSDFCYQHVIYNSHIKKYPKVEGYRDTERLHRLKRMIEVHMNYTSDNKIHTENPHSDYDRDKYKYVMKYRVNPITDMPLRDASALCYTLREIVNADPSRCDIVLDIFRNAHNRIIIFYNFNYERDLLLDLAFENDINIAEWSGHKHEPIPDKDSWLYLVQYTAGAEGWNCLSTNCIIFYSQNYSYKTMVQAAGRIDRLNSPFEDLYYYHIRSTAPIDLAIHSALMKKKNFNERSFAERG